MHCDNFSGRDNFFSRTICLVFVLTISFAGTCSGLITDLEEAKQFLTEYDRFAADILYQANLAEWAYATNITDYNRDQQVRFVTPIT